MWVMLYFLALEYVGNCHIQPDQISVQDELLWLLPVPGGAEPGVSPSWEGVQGPLKCRGAGWHLLQGFCQTALLYLSFQPHDEQILPCKFPQQTVPAPLHPGLRGEQGGYVGSPVFWGSLNVFCLYCSFFFFCFFGLMILSPLKQPSQRLASCSPLSLHSQCEPRVSLQSWSGTLPLCCLWLAGRPQKHLPECSRDGAIAVVKSTAFI